MDSEEKRMDTKEGTWDKITERKQMKEKINSTRSESERPLQKEIPRPGH